MSGLMTGLVKHCFTGKPELKLIAMFLADYADDCGESIFPSVKTLMAHSSMSERSVQRHLAELRAMGFLEVVSGKGGSRFDANGKRVGITSRARIAATWIKSSAEALGGKLGERAMDRVSAEPDRVPAEPDRVPNCHAKGATYLAPENTEERTQKENTHRASAGVCVSSAHEPASLAVLDALRSEGITDCSSADPKLRRFIAEGVPVEEFRYAASVAKSKGRGAAYALSIVGNRHRDAANEDRNTAESSTPVARPKAKAVPTRWWCNSEGIALKATELGLEQARSENWVAFTARVWLEAGEGPWICEANATTFRYYEALKSSRAKGAA
jgi:DNA-binding transcriptional ArsR family regulator